MVVVGRSALSRIDVDWFESSKTIVLIENAANWEFICIGQHNDRLRGITIQVDWYFGKRDLDLPKCLFRIVGPFPLW